jgi:hypothetical protein
MRPPQTGRRCVEAGDLRAQPRPRPADERWPELGPDPREEVPERAPINAR